VLRGGKKQLVNVLLSAPPGATDAELNLMSGSHPLSGAEVAVLSPALAESLGADPFLKGILVTKHPARRSIARRVGLRLGDIIVAINGRETSTKQQLEGALRSEDGSWQVTIERNGRRITTQRFRI
jgi:serine protease Do